jgi:type I restriction enzyme M protein
MLAGVVSMPSNIFATTGTNVSILFLDATNRGEVILIDASNLGEKVKDGKNQKTILSTAEEDQIIRVFNNKEVLEGFAVTVSYDAIAAKNYSLSAGQYFEVKVDHVELTDDQFEQIIADKEKIIRKLFADSRDLEFKIEGALKSLRYD